MSVKHLVLLLFLFVGSALHAADTQTIHDSCTKTSVHYSRVTWRETGTNKVCAAIAYSQTNKQWYSLGPLGVLPVDVTDQKTAEQWVESQPYVPSGS